MALHTSRPDTQTVHATIEGVQHARTVIETRTPDAEARDKGNAIYATVKRQPIWLDLSLSAKFVFSEICRSLGRIDSSGALRLDSRRQLEEDLRVNDRTTSAPLRELVDRGLLARCWAPGPRGHAYVVIPEPDPIESKEADADRKAREILAAAEEKARAILAAAAQQARASSAPASYCAGQEPHKTLPDEGLARASLAGASYRAGNDPRLEPENPEAAQQARASSAPARTARAFGDSTVRTSTLTFTSTEKGGGERPADLAWFLPWLLSLPEMKPHVARKWAACPMIDAKVAIAARYELEHSSASKKDNFNPAGLIIRILKNPQTQINDESWAYAEQLLGSDEGRPKQFTGTRVAELFDPSGSSPSMEVREGQSIEDRATEIQQTLPPAELAALHREAVAQMTSGVQRMFAAKADPRKLADVHALIVKRISLSTGGVR